jgi:hypothetical protein
MILWPICMLLRIAFLDFIMYGSSGVSCIPWSDSVARAEHLLLTRRAYNVIYGLFQAPFFAFSQTMMAELSPPGFDNMVRHCHFLSKRLPLELGRLSRSFLAFSDCRIVRRR